MAELWTHVCWVQTKVDQSFLEIERLDPKLDLRLTEYIDIFIECTAQSGSCQLWHNKRGESILKQLILTKVSTDQVSQQLTVCSALGQAASSESHSSLTVFWLWACWRGFQPYISAEGMPVRETRGPVFAARAHFAVQDCVLFCFRCASHTEVWGL